MNISPEATGCIHWYAIRVTYGREIKLQEMLNTRGINSFIPMQYKETIRGGRKTKILVPAIRNLIFIRSTRAFLDNLKKEVEDRTPMRYLIDNATRTPIVVPEEQMQSFIAVAGSLDEQLVYLRNIETAVSKGDRVRITGGVFAGVEGNVLRIRRDRRIVVTIEGVIAVATTYIHSSLLQKL